MDPTVFSQHDAKRLFVRRMFDGIAGTYDVLNHLLSAGVDVVWRRRSIDALNPEPGWRILDLATGTGDLGFEAAARGPGITVTGADVSLGMLRRGLAKRDGRSGQIAFTAGDAERLPFADATFDGLTIGFGIRNVAQLESGLAEMHRVLQEGGRLAVLEFSKPRAYVLRGPYFFYFRNVLPVVGRLVSKDPHAYSYLYESVMRFPEGQAFCDRLTGAGFVDVTQTRFTFGIATLYTGRKAT